MQSKNLEAYFAARSSKSASSLDQIARELRKEGMLPSGAKGRHAPKLAPDAIASFVIAASMAPSPSEAVQTVKDFYSLQPIFKVTGLALRSLKVVGISPPYTLAEYLACIVGVGWNDAQKHVRQITFRRRPPHSELLYRFDAEISGEEGWQNIFEPPQKKHRGESTVRHNHAENSLMVEEVTLRSEFLTGLFSVARQSE
jgi:hypothetical protein